MMKDLKASFGGKNSNVMYFRAEGITIIIPLCIGWHRGDVLNCLKQMFKSVISVNVSVPINDDTMPDGRDCLFNEWLKLNGCTQSFPCSVILYGRARVGNHCHNMARTKDLAMVDPCRRLTSHALLNHMRTVVDYKHQVYHNSCFPSLWKRHATVDPTSIFSHRMWKRPGAYDKMVRWYSH